MSKKTHGGGVEGSAVAFFSELNHAERSDPRVCFFPSSVILTDFPTFFLSISLLLYLSLYAIYTLGVFRLLSSEDAYAW